MHLGRNMLPLGCLSMIRNTSCAAATARVFSMKIGVLPDRVLMSLINDRMIAKGTILDFITAFFKDYLATDSMDDLVQLLRKARLDDRLLDFFPPQKRNLTDFDAHFKACSEADKATAAALNSIECIMNIAKKLQSARLLWSMSQMSNRPTMQCWACVQHSVLAVCVEVFAT